VLGSDRRGGLALADFRFEWPEPVILSHPFALLYNGAEARSWLLLSGFWSKGQGLSKPRFSVLYVRGDIVTFEPA
jgi:hypothetical protein